MKNRIRAISTVSLLSVLLTVSPSSSEATESTLEKPLKEQVGLFLFVRPALNLGFEGSSGTDNYLSFQGGLSGAYFFHRHIGIEMGVDFNQRAFMGTGFGGRTFFSDLAFGPTFAWAGQMGPDSRSHLHVGGFYSIPFGDFEPGIFNAEKFFGIRVATDTLVAMSERFSLGFCSYVKFPLGKMVSSPFGPTKSALLEVGLGFSASFQPLVRYAD